MNWYQQEKEITFHGDRAKAAADQKKLMRELKAMQDAQPREERMGFFAVLGSMLRGMRGATRRTKVGAEAQSVAPTGKVATGTGRGG